MYTLIEIQDKFQTYLNEHTFNQTPQALYAPVNYILSIGGKRLRPALLLMAANLFKDDIEGALPAAFAVEVFHNFTLLHDDIMDEAPLRRGKPTVHHKYNVNTGILSGDVMLIYAYQYLNGLSDKSKLHRILEIFNKTAIEVCEGQQYDMNFETQSDVTIKAYLKMIELKTSVLLAGGMQIGALITGASEQDAEHVYEFGRNVGLAFQLQDDILDAFGDPEKFGKKVGGDIIQNKKTYLYLKALEMASDADKTELKDWFSKTEVEEASKIERVKAIFKQSGVLDAAQKLQKEYQNKAFFYLNQISIDKARKERLISLANQMLNREN